MSHHLAEIMERAENEDLPEKRAEYQRQAVDLILKIWKHREVLQGNAYPLARFKDIIHALSILSPEANIWERKRLGKYESLAANTFSMIVELYRSLLFVEFVSLKSIKSKQFPPSLFSDEEQKMYELLTTWAKDELKFRYEDDIPKQLTEVQVAKKKVCEFIDDLCEKLKKLKGELASKK
jgi:hypothetical protein